MASLREMDDGRSKRGRHSMEVKKSPHQNFDYWVPNRDAWMAMFD